MKKILIVENSPTIISVADSLLRQQGFDVTCLSDGNKAFEFAKTEKPDLILSGLGLAGIDGIQLCHKITGDTITGGIPIVILVGDRDDAYLEKLELCGVKARIKKPFSPKELLSVVGKYTGTATSTPHTEVVNQKAAGAPKLKPKAVAQEVGTATRSLDKEKKADGRHETVFNLDWGELNDTDDGNPDSSVRSETDDSGLILEEDQYGLTNLSDEIVPAGKESAKEDYEWFVDEMKQETETPTGAKETAEPQEAAKDKVSYRDVGSSASKDDEKYRSFLEQFKKDTKVVVQDMPSSETKIDINWLVNEIAEKLAQKIVEKLDREELKQVITSILGNK